MTSYSFGKRASYLENATLCTVKDNLQQCASVIILWHRTTYHSHGHNKGFKIGEAGVWRPPDEAEKCE